MLETRIEYPKTFTACPNCGSTERFAEIETLEEIKKGNVSEGSRTPILISQTRVFDPNVKSILLYRKQIPVLLGFYDVCCACGTLYCCEMQKATGMVEPQIKGNHPPPPFGRG